MEELEYYRSKKWCLSEMDSQKDTPHPMFLWEFICIFRRNARRK